MQPINKKPQYLYHASSNKDIKIFEPRAESARHPKEGPKVFATETPEEDTKGWDREDDALVQETEIQIEREEGEDYGWGEND
jgi:hypothetical protein